MATCIASLFEIQKEQKRVTTSTTNAARRPASKNVVTCSQGFVFQENIIKKEKAKSQPCLGIDIDFIAQYATIVAPKYKDALIEALICNKENIHPHSEFGVMCFSPRKCPSCSLPSARPAASEGCGVFCKCGTVWCWRCVAPWDPCHMECRSLPNLTIEDIEAYIKLVIKPILVRKQPKEPRRNMTSRDIRPPLQLLR